MSDIWHRTADLVGLPGMSGHAKSIRRLGLQSGWISREVKWGARTRLEWLESSLPADTQAALRAASTPGDGSVPTAPGTTGDDGDPTPSPRSLLSETTPLARADARAGIILAFERWHAETGGPLVAGLRAFATLWTEGGIDACEARAVIPSIHWATLQRWRAIYLSGGRRAEVLIAGRGGRRSGVADNPEARDLVEAMLRANPNHTSARHIQRALDARLPGPAPSIASIRRHVRAWRAANSFGLSACSAPDDHRSRTMPAFGDGSWDVIALNQLWELDSTRLDVICADGVRWDVCCALDVWSRRGRALVTQKSSAEAISALGRRCLLEWGVPQTLRTDEGRDYTSKHLKRVVSDLQIEHDILPPYSPEQKPHVERFIGIMSHDLLSQLPGFCGHDVADAQRLRGARSYADRQGKDDTLVFKCDLTAEELQARIDTWCDSVYGREPRAGLDGMSPFEKAKSWTGTPPRRVSERGLDILLAPAAGNGRRKVGKDGIHVDGGTYIAGELGRYMGHWVHVRQDPGDWGRIYVFEDPDADGCGEFICVAEDPLRTGIDRAEVASIAKANWRARNAAERKRKRDLAREHTPDRVIDDVLEKAAKNAGKVVALTPRGEEHTTPATKSAQVAEAHDAATDNRRKRMLSEEEFMKKLWR